MVKIRIPESKTHQFKSFCKRFSKHFENQSGIRLRGNQLLNLVAKAAGHDSYTALLLDSKTYGNGSFQWDRLPSSLSEPIAKSTSTSLGTCLNALSNALLDEPDAVSEINGKISGAYNPFKDVSPTFSPLSTSSSLWSDNTGLHSHIFEEGFGEVDMANLMSSNPMPVIDLTVLENERALTDAERSSLHKIILHQYLSVPDEERVKVVFLGSKEAVLQLLQSNVTLAAELMKNPSIRSNGIELVFATTDINEFESASKHEIDSVLSNTRVKMILKDDQGPEHQLSAGELFAERNQTIGMNTDNLVPFVKNLFSSADNAAGDNRYFHIQAFTAVSALANALIEVEQYDSESCFMTAIVKHLNAFDFVNLSQNARLSKDSRSQLTDFLRTIPADSSLTKEAFTKDENVLRAFGFIEGYTNQLFATSKH